VLKPNQSGKSEKKSNPQAKKTGHGGARMGSGRPSKVGAEVKEILKKNSKTEEWLVGYLEKTFPESDYIYQKSSIPVAASFAVSSTVLFDDMEMVNFDVRSIMGDNEKIKIFAIYGDSMIDVGIYPTDHIFVEEIPRGAYVKPNTPVLVRLRDYLTVKTYKNRNGKIYLSAENAKLNLPEEPLGEDDQVFGIVRGSFRTQFTRFH
jgi:SOS-response transcriptional repressor LexA